MVIELSDFTKFMDGIAGLFGTHDGGRCCLKSVAPAFPQSGSRMTFVVTKPMIRPRDDEQTDQCHDSAI